MEIERKFLVAELPDLSETRAVSVSQGYVTRPGDSVSVRLRRKGDKLIMTMKSGRGLVREEHETEIDRATFDTFWPVTEGRRISKTRHVGALEDGTAFELDIFEGPHAPLVVVEVEFESREAAEAFVPPAWFGADVTDDVAYSNEAMAFEGRPLVA